MSNGIMYRKEAEKFLAESGWKLFLDKIIKEKIIVFPDIEIKTIYKTEQFEKQHGTVKLELWPEGLVLWVGGVIVWKQWGKA
jgi:hypothetical protein